MTRENKLALVVGFALILVVGILISDHFSTARSQKSAELGQVVDPTHPATAANAQLIEFDTGQHAEPLLQTGRVQHPAYPQDRGHSQPNNSTVVYDAVRTPPGDLRDPLAHQPRSSHSTGQTIELQPSAVQSLAFTYHHVKPNETLTAICKQYFGDTSLLRDLAAYNNIADMNMVPVGMRLIIPSSGALVRGEPTTVTLEQLEDLVDYQPTAPAAAAKTYTVQKGDTLGDISLRVLGTSRKWRTLYNFNKDVIKNPDRVIEGTVLKIPPA